MDRGCAGGSAWETASWPGSGEGRVNEDFALVREASRCAALVDGATGLTKANVVKGESDASWYARHLARALADRLARVGEACEVAGAYEHAGRVVAREFQRIPGAGELARIDEPNGSVATLVWGGERVLVTLLGDCTAVVGMADGSCQVLHDPTLTALDERNYERMYAHARERGTTMAEARRALNPRFIENRLRMNEPDGYWAADISCRGMGHAETHAFDACGVAWLFACSDGFAAAVDMGVAPDAAALARRVAQGQGEAVGRELRAAELDDAGCWRVHRSKVSDDATYVLVRLG